MEYGMNLRSNTILSLIILLGIMTGCNDEELKQLRQENLEMSQQIKEKDARIDELNQVNNQMEEKIQLLAQSGQWDSLNFSEVTSNDFRNNLERIRSNMTANQRKIQELNKRLNNAQYRSQRYNREIAGIKADLERQSDSLKAVKQEMKAKQQRINELIDSLDARDAVVAGLNEDKEQLKDSLSNLNNVLNTAYVAVYPKKELKEKDIIIKKGGFLGFIGKTFVLNPDFPRSGFKKMNIASESTITINTKVNKVELLTPHPESAYKLEKAEEQNKTILTITDSDQFWRGSNHLVGMY